MRDLRKPSRRTFVQLSTSAALAAASNRLLGETNDGVLRIRGENYVWEYNAAKDTFSLRDAHDRLIVQGKVQPAVVVAPNSDLTARVCTPGKANPPRQEPGKVTFTYESVNGTGKVTYTWRFEPRGIWTDPVIYQTSSTDQIVSLHYFGNGGDKASLHASYLVVPGISEGSAVSPILHNVVHLNQSVWLGRGSFMPGLTQQWGLPVHYFAGFSLGGAGGAQDSYTSKRSDAFACGLADLPSGDLFLQLYQGEASPWVDYRSDLWKHLHGPGEIKLGATFFWTFATDYRQAIAAYYRGLLDAGVIHKRENSAHKTAVMLTPEFCTWGSQVDRSKAGDHLDQAYLDEIYSELKASGMKAGTFSIDDKWEKAYGTLVHSSERLPHFEAFLDQLRTDGYKIGLWAALMRCERPADLGLTLDNVLKTPDGKPFLAGNFDGAHYYLLDFTQPKVEQVLTALARQFIRRYKPDLFKFDFGYELPSLSVAAPQDKQWTGERLMGKGLSLLINAMREENPDLVVMYYQLSPLFLDFFDLHSSDDLFLAAGEYDVEANRRFYFSSLLGPLGIPTYGSSGYDWASSPKIWFDSAAVGTIGSLNDFRNDEQGEGCTPELAAKYNGVARVLRKTSTFTVQPFGANSEAPSQGAHARSWTRTENGQLVLVAYRPPVPGEENPLASRIPDVVRAAVPVIVSSSDSESITGTATLAIVPYGSGEVSIRRSQGRTATVVCHFFGGATQAGKASFGNGFLHIAPVEQGKTPLEWIEVHIS
jgi:hypothetical protein